MKQEIKVPQMGESITEATVGALFKDTGSPVKMDEEILELETDKVNQVLYAPEAGTLNLTVSVDDKVTPNQVIGFILSVVICFVLVLVGWGVFTELFDGIFPAFVIDLISSIGFTQHFQAISRGLVDTRDLIYFFSTILVALSLNVIVLQSKKAS